MVDLFDYSEDFKIKFEKEKNKISKVLKFGEIIHIGSTAVRGIKGKGIIDIMIAIKDWKRKLEIVEILKSLGYLHIHKEEKERVFLSKVALTKNRDFHIHLVKKESFIYRELLKFLEILNENENLRKEYEDLKIKLNNKNREEYREIKGKFIKKVLKIF